MSDHSDAEPTTTRSAVIEAVRFRLAEAVTEADFLAAVAASRRFIEALPGFRNRRLSVSANGEWLDHVEWESLEAAGNAAAAFQSAEEVGPFVRCIDGASVVMTHGRLVG